MINSRINDYKTSYQMVIVSLYNDKSGRERRQSGDENEDEEREENLKRLIKS